MALDGNILLYIQDNIRCDILDKVFVAISSLGNFGIIWIIIAVVLMISKKHRKTGVMVMISIILSLIVNNAIIKNIVARTRPFDMIDGLTAVIDGITDPSFPSGHTACSFAAAMVIAKRMPKKIGIPLIILACLIGLSRLYLGVHYPTDVLVGAISGCMMAFITRMIVPVN